MSISRRGFLHSSAAIFGGIGLASVAATQATAKIAPNLIGYQPFPKDGHNCANCKLFLAPNSCKNVDGAISPNGWCKIWLQA